MVSMKPEKGIHQGNYFGTSVILMRGILIFPTKSEPDETFNFWKLTTTDDSFTLVYQGKVRKQDPTPAANAQQ